jgi:hypothetical protein
MYETGQIKYSKQNKIRTGTVRIGTSDVDISASIKSPKPIFAETINQTEHRRRQSHEISIEIYSKQIYLI